MDHKIVIYSLHNHCLQIPVEESKMLELYQDITNGLATAKKKGLYYTYEHNLHPFMCHPEHVQSVTIMRTPVQEPENEAIAEAANG